MIEKVGVHMVNHSSGWFALINVKNFPFKENDDIEIIYDNTTNNINFSYSIIISMQSRFVPIVGYNARIAVKKLFEDKNDN